MLVPRADERDFPRVEPLVRVLRVCDERERDPRDISFAALRSLLRPLSWLVD